MRATPQSFNNNDGQVIDFWYSSTGGAPGSGCSGSCYDPNATGNIVELDGTEIHPAGRGGVNGAVATGGPGGCLDWAAGKVSGWCNFGPWDSATQSVVPVDTYAFDPTQYHTYGWLSLVDQNDLTAPNRECGSIDGVWTHCFDNLAALSSITPGFFSTVVNGIMIYTGSTGQTPTTLNIKSVRLFSCPTWNTTNDSCEQTGGYPTISVLYHT